MVQKASVEDEKCVDLYPGGVEERSDLTSGKSKRGEDAEMKDKETKDGKHEEDAGGHRYEAKHLKYEAGVERPSNGPFDGFL